jgi:hypothetical protein
MQIFRNIMFPLRFLLKYVYIDLNFQLIPHRTYCSKRNDTSYKQLEIT